MVADDDVRPIGERRYLAGRTMKWMAWRQPGPERVRDHCAFCWAEISDAPVDGQVKFDAAWVTTDDEGHWVCPECFDDFRSRFRWIVTRSNEKGTAR